MSKHRISKLKIDKIKPLCRYFGERVTMSQWPHYERLKKFRFDPSFVMAALSCKWTSIDSDWEQRLVLDINAARMMDVSKLNISKTRPKSCWFEDTDLLRDLVPPLQEFMVSIGFSKTRWNNSFAAAISHAQKGFTFARQNPACAFSVKAKGIRCIMNAFSGAQDAFNDFLSDLSPDAEPPKYQIPLDSTYHDELDRAMYQTKRLVDIVADCEEAADVLGGMNMLKRPADATTLPALPAPLIKKPKPQGNSLAYPSLF